MSETWLTVGSTQSAVRVVLKSINVWRGVGVSRFMFTFEVSSKQQEDRVISGVDGRGAGGLELKVRCSVHELRIDGDVAVLPGWRGAGPANGRAHGRVNVIVIEDQRRNRLVRAKNLGLS